MPSLLQILFQSRLKLTANQRNIGDKQLVEGLFGKCLGGGFVWLGGLYSCLIRTLVRIALRIIVAVIGNNYSC